MENKQCNGRRNGWKSPQGIAGVLLVVVGLLIVAPQVWACVCTCYYNTDCAAGERCDREGCDPTTVNNKLRKGLCKKDGTVTPTEQVPASTALYAWIEAYAVAGEQGGGEPDSHWIAQAQAQPLTPSQQESIRDVAISIVRLALGSTEFPDAFHANGGLFASPQVATLPGEPCGTGIELDHGLVAPLDTVHLGALAIIQSAVVGELFQPGLGILEAEIARLRVEEPAYETFGVCEFPHIMTGMYRFQDGQHCLESELRGMVYSLLAQAPVNTLDEGNLRTLGKLFPSP